MTGQVDEAGRGRVPEYAEDWWARAIAAEGQVAAIRALCDEAEAYTPGLIGKVYTDEIRAALVASSPTTPEAPK